ncbi:MAG: hypothetical protein V4674_04305 [Patescibacteria group bacterium]
MMGRQERWIERYREVGGWWEHGGNPKQPHPLLTSGSHSGAYVNSRLIMRNPVSLIDVVDEALGALAEAKFPFEKLDLVSGIQFGSITLADQLAAAAWHFREDDEWPIYTVFAEKRGEGKEKQLVFDTTKPEPGERTLMADDVLTSGGSLEKLAKAIVDAKGVVMPWAFVIVNRTGRSEVGGRRIVSLIEKDLPLWSPDACPLRKQGSEAIRPKSKEAWERLNASY